jgi:hypothetical protein
MTKSRRSGVSSASALHDAEIGIALGQIEGAKLLLVGGERSGS